MALPSEFLDELRARTPMQALVGRRVKLTKSGRNWKGCCPFHSEKTASFYVYDDGFHCFGCGAHGDAVSFVMRTSGAGFPEAVESLAAEAGLDVPKPSARAAQAEQQRLGLHGVLELAQASFIRRLRSPAGAAGLAYLRGRGLSEATIARFGLGWSGDGRGELIAELRQGGVEPAQALEAGLLRETEEGTLRELYWGRITFPIRDRRGRLISFGGRALGDVKPKYINGPDTAVFHKRRTLYALDLAREGVRAGQRMILAEGYMDVIALHQAGFTGAVAPLGTALTAEQLAEIWRVYPEPVLCFDGDAAGAGAAERAIVLALANLTPGYSLRIATLPANEDPDSLIRKDGPRRFEGVLDAARPIVDAAYAAFSGGVGDAPEQRAALRTRLEAAAKTIQDRVLGSEFRAAFLDRFFGSRKGRSKSQPVPARQGFDQRATQEHQAMILIAIVLKHPELLHRYEEDFDRLPLGEPLAALRAEISAFAGRGPLDSDSLLSHLHNSDVSEEAARVLSATWQDLPECVRADASPSEVQTGWWHFYSLLTGPARLEEEIAHARRKLEADFSKSNSDLLVALREVQLTLAEFPELN